MALTSGTRIGPYEVTALIGEGGMGKVWRAHHVALNRDDALKVLPDAFASDPDRVARFRREAQVLASLNHPNIAHVYGLEQADGVQALVMELVEGPTLADRIARGPIALDEALPIAKQIADALEAAHEHGIIHRDLKPANIKVRPDGTVKVLDFGLAKLTEPAPLAASGASLSPTITSPAMTGVGVLLGTAAYMAPEQARGKPADKRCDIWAFGCVLFEMLTSTCPFGGDDVTETIAAIVKGEPDWLAVPADVPTSIRRLLRHCLEKDPHRRLRDIGDAQIEIADALAHPAADASVPVKSAPRWRRIATGGVLCLLGAGVAAMILSIAGRQPEARPLYLAIPTSGPAALALSGTRDVAVSPDGQRIVYIGANGSKLFVRQLDQSEAKPLDGLGVPHHPFFSPDGQWIGFFDGTTTLKKVRVSGGPAIAICGVGSAPQGGAWISNDRIAFSTAQGVLYLVDAAGGAPRRLETPNREFGDAFPEPLSGRNAFLFTRVHGHGSDDVGVFDVATAMPRVILRDATDAHYTPTGHLVYASGSTLRAVEFDLTRLQVSGTPVPVLDHLMRSSFRNAEFDVSATGTLVYLAGDVPPGIHTLAWVDRTGREEPIDAPPRAYAYPRLSPDGQKLALDVRDQDNDIWIWDFGRATLARFTFDPGFDQYPVWTPDGRQLIFVGVQGGRPGIHLRSLDGVPGQQLTDPKNPQFAQTISPDGQLLIYREDSEATGQDLMMLSLATRTSQPLVQTAAHERNAEISPDGRWLAYESTESGQPEIYVRPMAAGVQGRWQVSTGGGTRPLWARSGPELFYVSSDGSMMSVAIEPGASFTPGSPKKLFSGRYYYGGGVNAGRTYDVSPDGKRFLMVKEGSADPNAAPPTINLVLNWFDELKRLVPTK